jgi:hypothetical protein
MKHHQPNKTKHGKDEAKAKEEASSEVIRPLPARPQFTKENFKEALITFIIEDDQVSDC